MRNHGATVLVLATVVGCIAAGGGEPAVEPARRIVVNGLHPGESSLGVVVESDKPRSAAEAAGLRPGDVLLSWSRIHG